jgi:hypothetical protein
MGSSLVYLGTTGSASPNGYDGSPCEEDSLLDMVAVLVGVEIVNGQANKSKMQMVKHSSTRREPYSSKAVTSSL